MSEFWEVAIAERKFANLLFLNVQSNMSDFIAQFDTGATMSVVKKSLLDALGLKKGKATVHAGNNNGGIFELETVVIPSLKIGKTEIHDICAVVFEDEAFSFGEDEDGNIFPADMLLGWDVISKHAWKCDMHGGTLQMKEGGSLPKKNLLQWKNFPLICVNRVGQSFIAGLDTGHTETVLGPVWKNSLANLESHDTEIYGVGSVGQYNLQYVKDFEFSHENSFVSLKNIDIVNEIFGAPPGMDALFGIDILRDTRWEMDYLSGWLKIETNQGITIN